MYVPGSVAVSAGHEWGMRGMACVLNELVNTVVFPEKRSTDMGSELYHTGCDVDDEIPWLKLI